jgi:choline/glycine/proline betaine transport protein
MVDYPSRQAVFEFIENTVTTAMKSVQDELEAREWKANVKFDNDAGRAIFTVERHDHMDFIYDIRMTEYLVPGFSYAELRTEQDESEKYFRAEVFLRRGGQAYDIYGYDKESIAKDILDQFESYLHFLDTSPGELPWSMEAHDDMLKKTQS